MLEWGSKTLEVDYEGCEELINGDRLKPAHMDGDVPLQVAEASRSGWLADAKPKKVESTVAPHHNCKVLVNACQFWGQWCSGCGMLIWQC